MEYLEIIHTVTIQEYNVTWGKNFYNLAVDPSQMTVEEQMLTAYVIWAKHGFNFTTLRVRYKRGGYLDIPMPVNKLNFKKNYKEIQAKKVLNKEY